MLFDPKTYKKDEDLSQAIWDFKQRSQTAYAALRDTVWPLCDKMYHSVHDPALFARWAVKAGTEHPFDVLGGAGIFDPVPFYQVEAKVPPIHEAVFGDGDVPFLCEPYPTDLRFGDAEIGELWQHAAARQRFLTAQWYGQMKMHVLGTAMIRDVAKFGNVPLLFERCVTREPLWAQRETEAGEYAFGAGAEYVTRRSVRCTPIPLADFFPDERGRSMDGVTGTACKAAAIRLMLTADELISWIIATPALGWNIPADADRESREALRAWLKKTAVIGSVTSEDDWPAQRQYEVGRRSTVPSSTSDKDDQRILLLRYYEGGDDPRHVMIAGRDGTGPVLLNQNGAKHPCRNAGIPIALIQSVPILHELFGLSTIEEIMFLAAYNNLLINLDLGNRVRSVNGIGLINPLSGLSAERMASLPGGQFEVNSMVTLDNAYKRIEVPFVNQEIQQIVSALRQQMHVTAGGVDPLLGFASGETARAAMIATEQGSRRWGGEANEIRKCLTRGGEIVDGINMQFVTRAEYFQVIGKTGAESWDTITPQAYGEKMGKVRLFLDSRPLVGNAGARAQAINNFAVTYAALPGTDLNYLRVEHAKALKLSNPDKVNLVKQNREDHENAMFLDSIKQGTPRFNEVSPADKHADHMKAHWDVEPQARQAGKAALMEWGRHYTTHGQAMGGGPGAGPQGAPSGEEAPPEGAAGPEGGMPIEAGAPAMDEFANEAAQTPELAPRG